MTNVGQMKQSRHGPQCGHTPLDIVSSGKNIKHGSVRIDIMHFLYLVFLIFAVPFLLHFSFLMIFLLVILMFL